MAQGRFSSPRPHREEERKAKQNFRQAPGRESAPQDFDPFPDRQDEQLFDVSPDGKEDRLKQEAPVTQGRFSKPRPNRDKEREIGQAPGQNAAPDAFEQVSDPSEEDTFDILSKTDALFEEKLSSMENKYFAPRSRREEDREIEEAFRQVTGQKAAPQASQPEEEALDLFLGTEEDEPSEDSFAEESSGLFSKVLAFCSKNKKVVLVATCAVALVLIVGFIAIFFAGASDPYDGKILNNVYIADINVGGMTKKEAISAVEQTISQSYAKEYMVIDVAGTTLRLSPANAGATLDVTAVVNDAYDYGRTGTQAEQESAYQNTLTGSYIIGLLPYLELDEYYIRGVLNTYADDAGSALTQASYGLEGEQPKLDMEGFDPDAPCQTLVITMGTPGIYFDADAVYDQILDAYSLRQFQITVEDVDSVAEPDPVDLEAIYAEFYIAPVNATLDMQNLETIPGSYGYGFDLEAAQKLIDNAEYGEEIRIPMEYIEPETLGEVEFFQDVLGECQTPYTSITNRDTNLLLACQALNGLVLNPGDTFSFNETVGQPTTEKGYKFTTDYSGNTVMDVLGGGISQVSSTLYYCTLLSDLETVSRTNHNFYVSYIDYGMDADVSWGSTDFQFKNSTNYPIKIEADASGGYVKIKIWGTDQRDYYIKMEYDITSTEVPVTKYMQYEYGSAYQDGETIQNGITGYSVKTYKAKYDKQTNSLISRDFEANSQYKSLDKLVARVKGAAANTQPTDPIPPDATDPIEDTTPPVVTDPADDTTPPVVTDPPEDTTPPVVVEPTPTIPPAEETSSSNEEPDNNTWEIV